MHEYRTGEVARELWLKTQQKQTLEELKNMPKLAPRKRKKIKRRR